MGRLATITAALAVATPFAVGLAVAPEGPRPARVVFTFTDPAIVESSGLVARDGLVYTVNDSGDSGRVFAVDPVTGNTVGVTSWAQDPRDVEALAPAGPREVWVGDIGDNDGVRDSVEVLRVPVGRGDRTVEPVRVDLRYPGGGRDAETLLSVPGSGRLVIVTKGVFGGEVYLAPARLADGGSYELRRIGSARGIATDGSFLPDGRHLVVRDYGGATVYAWPSLDAVGSFDLPDQEQGEGLTVTDDGEIWVSTEGAYTEVLLARVPAALRRAIAPPPEPSASSATSPTPSSATPSAGAEPPDDSTSSAVGDGAWEPWILGTCVAGVAAAVALVVVRRRRAAP